MLGWLVGLGAAAAFGLAIYRGALRIDLGRFFRWTGVLLVFVAAGILSYGVHDLQEAGVLPGLNTLAFDVSTVVDPSSWYAALLKGILNFTPQTTVLQAVGVGALRRHRPAAVPAPAPRPARPQAPSLPTGRLTFAANQTTQGSCMRLSHRAHPCRPGPAGRRRPGRLHRDRFAQRWPAHPLRTRARSASKRATRAAPSTPRRRRRESSPST